jgi:hypothetical protein
MVHLSFLNRFWKISGCPALVPRLHELTAFRDLAEANRRVAEPLDQRGDRGSCALVIARQEYDPSSVRDDRIFSQDACGQVVEALHELSAGEEVSARDQFSASITRS